MWFAGATGPARDAPGNQTPSDAIGDATRDASPSDPIGDATSRASPGGRHPGSVGRRAVLVGTAIALAGCAGGGTPGSGGEAAGANGHDVDAESHPGLVREPVARGWDQDSLGDARELPDIEVVNESDHGVTAYLAIYGRDWFDLRFRATVSLRGPVHDELPVRVTFPDVDVADDRSVLSVETARGLHGRHQWHGGGDDEGLWVHVRETDVGFHHLSR